MRDPIASAELARIAPPLPVDDAGRFYSRDRDDYVDTPRPCKGCGQLVSQAFERTRYAQLPPLDVEHVQRFTTSPYVMAWHPRLGWVHPIAGGELYHDLALFTHHDCPADTRRRGARHDAKEVDGMSFGTPKPPGDGVKQDTLLGHPLLIVVRDKRLDMVTSAGTTNALVVDLVVLDTGEEHSDTLLFGKSLVAQLDVGTTYCGRIIKGQAQPGKNAPWLFQDNPADHALGSAYLAHKSANAAPAPSATPAFVPQQAAPAAAPVSATPPWA